MVRLIRNNNPFTVIILFIYALVINYQVLFNPRMPGVQEGQFLFGFIVNFLNVIFLNSAFIFTLFSILSVAIQGIMLNAIANNNKLFPRNGYAVAFTYITLASVYPYFGFFSSALVANWSLVVVIGYILELSQTARPRRVIFNMAFIIGLTTVIHFSFVGFILLLFMSLSLQRPFTPGEWLVALLGVITPIYLVAGVLFLFDSLYLMKGIVSIGANLPHNMYNPMYLIGVVVGVITLFVLGIYALQEYISRLNVYVRRSWSAIAIALFISILVAIMTIHAIEAAWLLVIPCLGLIIANAYYHEKNKAFSNFAFYFMIVLLVFCKITFSLQ